MENIFGEDLDQDCLSELSQSQSQNILSSSSGSEYFPDSEPESDSEEFCFNSQEENFGDTSRNPAEDRKVIVNFSHLFELLSICREANCGSLVPRESMKISVNGAMIRVRMICNNNHEKTWSSSPVLENSGKGTFSATNVQLASYCLLTGMHITQLLEFMDHMRILCFSSRFFYYLQSEVLASAVWRVWLYSQAHEIEKLSKKQNEDKAIHLIGDGKYDSPGHTACYCTYSIQDSESKAIVALYVAHKNQLKSSAEMEPFSCKILLLQLAIDFFIHITTFTTDRSSSIETILSKLHEDLPDGYPSIQHCCGTSLNRLCKICGKMQS